jgi:hypothetical protein
MEKELETKQYECKRQIINVYFAGNECGSVQGKQGCFQKNSGMII